MLLVLCVIAYVSVFDFLSLSLQFLILFQILKHQICVSYILDKDSLVNPSSVQQPNANTVSSRLMVIGLNSKMSPNVLKFICVHFFKITFLLRSQLYVNCSSTFFHDL